MLRTLSLLFMILIGSSAFAAEAPSTGLTESQKIDYLLNALETSHVAFIRNDVQMTSADASKHLRDKLATMKDSVTTAEDFIAKVASTSSHTGKPYIIRMKDGTDVPAAQWFHEKLAAREGKTVGK